MNTLEIAQVIKSQISGRELMALGAHKYCALSTGGLSFHVSLFGRKKAIVAVKLDANKDLYNVEFYTGRVPKKVKEIKEIFCDDLTDTISVLCEAHFAGKLSKIQNLD